MRNNKKSDADIILDYNLYNLKIMACLSSARGYFGIWDYHDMGLHLQDATNQHDVYLAEFPKYNNYFIKKTNHEFQTTEQRPIYKGVATYLLPCKIADIQNKFQQKIGKEHQNAKSVLLAKDLTEDSITRYLMVLMREEKYGRADGESRENISNNTVFNTFFNDDKSVYLIPDSRVFIKNLGTTLGFIDSVNKNFGLNLQYTPEKIETLTFGALRKDVIRQINNRIAGNWLTRKPTRHIIIKKIDGKNR